MQELGKILEEIKDALKDTYLDIANNYDVSDLRYDSDKVACVAGKFRREAGSRIENIIRKHMSGKDKDVLTNNGWIPVDERLPEKDGFYLVSLDIPTNIDDLKMSRAWFSEAIKSFSEYGKAVTAWRPLPEPYRPEEKGAFAEMRKNVMNIEGKIRYIADYYGYEPQSRQLIEEMAELTVAINKLWRRHEYGATSKEIAKAHMDVLEEIADVTVMLCQIQYLLGISSPELDYATERKLNRQIERIHKITREE